MGLIRFGIIGLGRGRSYARVLLSVGGAEVVALYDVDQSRAEAAAHEIGARAYGSLEAFLSSEIDAVVVASPIPFHAEQSGNDGRVHVRRKLPLPGRGRAAPADVRGRAVRGTLLQRG